MKKTTDNEKVFSSDHVMSFLENINEGIQLIAEVQGEHTKKFEAIDKRFEAVDKKFETIDRRFEAIDRKLDKMQEDIEVIKHNLSKKADAADLQKLRKIVLAA